MGERDTVSEEAACTCGGRDKCCLGHTGENHMDTFAKHEEARRQGGRLTQFVEEIMCRASVPATTSFPLGAWGVDDCPSRGQAQMHQPLTLTLTQPQPH